MQLRYAWQAASVGDSEEISRLLNNGVRVNAADYDGRTALVKIIKSVFNMPVMIHILSSMRITT